ncbi:MAG: GNAT family N-acetyltransferase [Hyphomicrobium sp.]|nr:GNAT family N-acetyltransferase [Hyphomicrobium sp.]
MLIRAASAADRAAIWAILEPIIRDGETYALPRDMGEADAIAYWTGPGRQVFVAEADGVVVGTYFLRCNQLGGGDHVANAAYATDRAQRGRGIARKLAEHSLAEARDRGFSAMQFNFVVSTNATAIHLWQSLGFETVGRLPGAFRHPQLGCVDALVMSRKL